MSKLLKTIIVVSLIFGLAMIAYSAEPLYQVKFPAKVGDRFWLSSSGAANLTVTFTDSDTLSGSGHFLSRKFDLHRVLPNGSTVTASKIAFFGESVACVDYDTQYPDSIQVLLVGYTAAGDSGFWQPDTLVMDTTSIVVMTSGARLFFMTDITMTDKKGTTVVPYRGALYVSSLETTADDTFQVDDCGVIIYYTD